MQFSLFDKSTDGTPGDGEEKVHSSLESMLLPLPDAHVQYFPNAIASAQADTYFETLKAQLPWRQDAIKLFGKSVKIPRLQSWHGDPQCQYTYSHLTMQPNPWTHELTDIKILCESLSGSRFNSVLANWYRDGQDSMSFHADDEAELGVNPVIASVTFGQARPFVFKHKVTRATYRYTLNHGSVLVMAGETQRHYVHGIAKTAKPIGGRINLTFRQLIL